MFFSSHEIINPLENIKGYFTGGILWTGTVKVFKFLLDILHLYSTIVSVFGTASRVVKKTGKRFTAPFCQRFTVENSLITKFMMYEDTRLIEKAFVK
jgi:hypothetical protein